MDFPLAALVAFFLACAIVMAWVTIRTNRHYEEEEERRAREARQGKPRVELTFPDDELFPDDGLPEDDDDPSR